MSFSVINVSCQNLSRMNSERISAKWILLEMLNAHLSPSEIVTASSCVWSGVARACTPGRFARFAKSAGRNQKSAIWTCARFWSSIRHLISRLSFNSRESALGLQERTFKSPGFQPEFLHDFLSPPIPSSSCFGVAHRLVSMFCFSSECSFSWCLANPADVSK
jgi:hypothetical protein